MALTFFTFVFAIGAIICSRTRGETITQEELVRRTQEFLDAIPSGDRTPWKKYFADDCMVFDEKGQRMDKKALLDSQSPMPAGYSGAIKVVTAEPDFGSHRNLELRLGRN
jgi:hypothetical protein